MAAVNAHLAAMYESYLFSEVDRRVQAYRAENPQKRLLRLGIGDVSRPLAPTLDRVFVGAAEEMGQAQSFRGYGPTRGYPFLLQAIIEREYEPVGVKLSQEDVFVSDGAKTDMAALQELFAPDAVAAVCDPVYPVYTDANRMAGRKIVLLPCSQEDGFLPAVAARAGGFPLPVQPEQPHRRRADLCAGRPLCRLCAGKTAWRFFLMRHIAPISAKAAAPRVFLKYRVPKRWRWKREAFPRARVLQGCGVRGRLCRGKTGSALMRCGHAAQLQR